MGFDPEIQIAPEGIKVLYEEEETREAKGVSLGRGKETKPVKT